MDTFKNLYKLDRLKDASLSDYITYDRSWKFDFSRILSNYEANFLVVLLDIIGSIPPMFDALLDNHR